MTIDNDPSTLMDFIVIYTVLFFAKIYDFLMFMVNHEEIKSILIDVREVVGVGVAILGAWYMLLKIKKIKRQDEKPDGKDKQEQK